MRSKRIDLKIYFDREQLLLTIESKQPIPFFDNEPLFDFDFYDNPREKRVKAGPFHDLNENRVIFNVDPRM